MSKSKKPIDTSGLVDELTDMSFFKRPAPVQEENKETEKQGNMQTSLQENKETRKLVNKETVKQVSKETRKRATYPKVTYQLNPTVTNLLQDAKIALQRQYNIKISLVEIVEEAIQRACTDLQENKETSFLVSLFTRKQEIT